MSEFNNGVNPCFHYAGGSKRNRATAGLAVLLLTSTGITTPVYAGGTATPIKHVIVIIGENRSFDHIFATYKPVNPADSVLNLLSKKIVNEDGSPGPDYREALQYMASDTKVYELEPHKTGAYVTLPPALTGGPSTPFVCTDLNPKATGTSCVTPANLAAAKMLENGLPDAYYSFLLTGGTGQSGGVPDSRIDYDGHDASHLPPGPFQITSKTFPYDAYAASPVHRFYQMWQQLDCNAAAASGERMRQSSTPVAMPGTL